MIFSPIFLASQLLSDHHRHCWTTPVGRDELESAPLVSLWSRLGLGGDGDAALARSAGRGNRRAFDALVHAHNCLLRGFLVRRVGSEAADDVLQETWLAAWTALPGFAGRSRFKAWLFGIAAHKAADAQRAQSRAPVPWPEGADEILSTPADPFAAADLKRSVQATLATLPSAQREVLELYYYAELTLPEIAAALERNLNTVKYQFYQAHAKAGDGLREYAPASSGGRP